MKNNWELVPEQVMQAMHKSWLNEKENTHCVKICSARDIKDFSCSFKLSWLISGELMTDESGKN